MRARLTSLGQVNSLSQTIRSFGGERLERGRIQARRIVGRPERGGRTDGERAS